MELHHPCVGWGIHQSLVNEAHWSGFGMWPGRPQTNLASLSTISTPQSGDTRAPQRAHSWRRNELFEMEMKPKVNKRNRWIQVGLDYWHALWNVISRRCTDFAETESSFRAMRKQKVYDNLVQELDAIETYAIETHWYASDKGRGPDRHVRLIQPSRRCHPAILCHTASLTMIILFCMTFHVQVHCCHFSKIRTTHKSPLKAFLCIRSPTDNKQCLSMNTSRNV